MTKWRASHAWMTAVDVYESLSHTLIRPWLSLSMNELVSRCEAGSVVEPPMALAKCRSSSSSMMVPWPDP